MTRLVAVAHFSPPVHGMAVAVDHLVGELERSHDVRRVSVSGPSLTRSATYHGVRLVRVAVAIAVLARERARSREAFFSCDAGVGMVYTALLGGVARLLGYRFHLQHHSYAYIGRRSRLLAATVRLLGPACTHLVSCPRMKQDFQRAYPTAAVRVVGILGAVELGDTEVRDPHGTLVLGYLGNVTLEKGVDLAVATVQEAVKRGVPVTLRVAGPVVDAAAAAVLERAVREGDGVVSYVGPVYGADRDAFFDEIDVFLFPSRYSHESLGLVAWEAMARAVPVLAHRAGCLTADAVGDGGLVLEQTDDFAGRAASVLAAWWQEPDVRTRAAEAGRRRAVAAIESAQQDVSELNRDLFGPRP